MAGEDVVTTAVFSTLDPVPDPPDALPSTTLAPLIYHVSTAGVTTEQTLHTFLTTHTPLCAELLLSLATFGGVYLHSDPSPRTSPRAVRQSKSDLRKPVPLRTRLYARIHAHPKRYDALFAPRVLARHDGVLAVHKPPGLPTCAGVDNVMECMTHALRARVTSRLDIGTSGVVLLAEDGHSARRANDMLAVAKKTYLVWATGDVRAGVLRDWRGPGALARGTVRDELLSASRRRGWAELVLVVERVACVFDDVSVAVVRLVTGRTHQIRLQFAARGWAVVGDDKYASVVGRVYQAAEERAVLGGDALRLGLHCWRLRGVLHGSPVEFVADYRARADLMAAARFVALAKALGE